MITDLEIALAQKTPVMQAEHAMDDEHPALKLYDCLIPKLREHRRFRIIKDDQFSMKDFIVQHKLRTLERELEKRELPKVQEEIKALRQKVEAYENNCSIVEWYLSVMEEGIDTREVVQKYHELTKKHQALKEETDTEIA